MKTGFVSARPYSRYQLGRNMCRVVSPATAAALASVRSALQRAEIGALAATLESLISAEPVRWAQLLLVDGGLRDPVHPEFPARFACLTRALSALYRDRVAGESEAAEVIGLVRGVSSLSALLESVRQRLKNAPFTQEPADQQTFRLACFLESQSFLVGNEMLATAVDDKGCLIAEALDSSYKATPFGRRVSGVDVIENLIDAIELIIRFRHASAGVPPSQAMLETAPSPYPDRELFEAIRLAYYWNAYRDAWARVKYLHWRGVQDSDSGIVTIVPPDEIDFQRSEVGRYRDAYWLIEASANVNQVAAAMTDVEELRDRLASSVRVPQQGQLWDGFVDLSVLMPVIAQSKERLLAEYFIDARHYGLTADRVRFDPKSSDVTWSEWLDTFVVLRELGAAFSAAARAQVTGLGADGCLRAIAVVDRRVLANVVAAVTDMTGERCHAALSVLLFDRTRRHVDVYAQPLLPLSDGDRVLFVPSLVLAAHPVRALESALAEYGDPSPELRGTGFEHVVAAHFSELRSASVALNVEVQTMAGETVEFDVLVWWQRYLFVIESKFMRGIHSAEDEWRARKALNGAFAQLKRRKEVVLSDWTNLRVAAPALSLPQDVPDERRIRCLAVTTVTQFTGEKMDGSVVVDERSVKRFFSDGEVAAFMLHPDGTREKVATTSRFWFGDEPTPDAFLAYVDDPPQAARIRKRLRSSAYALPIVEQGDPRVLVAATELLAPDPIEGS